MAKIIGPYYGVGGTGSIYNPKVDQKDQSSAARLWVQNGPIDTSNQIAFGWHVSFILGIYFDIFLKKNCL